jgi:hypothetical protein
VSEFQILQLCILVAALGFGAATICGVVSGKTLAFHDVARREQGPSWFRFWMFVNGATALLCLITLVVLGPGA